MVIMEALYREQDLPVLNVFLFTKFAPDVQIGHRMDPAKIDRAFRFISRSLTLLRNQEGKSYLCFINDLIFCDTIL